MEPTLAMLGDALLNACDASSMPAIERGRLQVVLMPKEWVQQRILETATKVLNQDDDWVFRRLLELLSMVCPELVESVVTRGLMSSNLEIREAAQDFSCSAYVESVGREFSQSLALRRGYETS